jgi:hypothetical protein
VATRLLDLRLDQRRRFVFGYASVQSATKFAVAQAVQEINAQPDGKPSNKAPLRLQGETEHKQEAKKDTE